MTIQLFSPSYHIDECLNEIRECFEKGWTGLGFKTVKFEEDWKAYTGHQNAHFLSSNTAGLHLAFHILKNRLGWQDGDEVITTSFTFVATNHAILYENLSPVFADINDYLCLDPDEVRNKITSKTRAVIFVGIGGNIGSYHEIVKICKENNLALILDAAHMAGTRYEGQHVGHEADAVVYSFQAVKNLPTADSGMICLKNKDDDVKVRELSWLGINKDTYSRTSSDSKYKWQYDIDNIGYKYHGNSIMAAIGIVQLKYLDKDNKYRRQVSEWYKDKLDGVDGIKLIPVKPGCDSASHLFQIRVSNRDDLMLKLNENGIYPGVHYQENTVYAMYRSAHGTCPNSEKASAEVISLPLHLGITEEDVGLITDVIKEFVR